MKNSIEFDVLVLYSGTTASSAQSSESTIAPFLDQPGKASYNSAYEYFLDHCKKEGLTAGLSTTTDVIGEGACNSYWVFKNKNWEKVNSGCHSRNILDKFSYQSTSLKTQQLLGCSKKTRPLNSRRLKKLFSDKLETYTQLPDYTIPTVALQTSTAQEVTASLKKLQRLVSLHPQPQDFSDIVILKDRTGSEGNFIFKFTSPTSKKIRAITAQYPEISFVLQPFVHFDTGYTYNNQPTAADIRLIYQDGKIVQTYLRMPKKNDFRCNQHQGGTVIYTNISDIPSEILELSQSILTHISDRESLYALDFLVANSGTVYLLEGNCNPGLIWDANSAKDEQMAKQLIRGIVKEFALRVAQ